MNINLILLFIVSLLFSSCNDAGLEPPAPGPVPIVPEEVDPFSNIPSLDEMVVYEVNLRAYSTTGNLAGVTANMDHIESLGVNVIWLMPIYPIGEVNSVNSPYAIRDYVGVNSEFGTINDLIDLVNEAHSRNIAVILDWVANHTAWDHAWINTPSWYVQDDEGNIIEPPGTGWTDVAELNFDNQDMKDEMIASMKFWIQNAGIDGYRCDAIDFVPDSFWSAAIAQVNASTEKVLIWLGEGAESSNFTVGFEFNYSWAYYDKMLNIYSNDHAASSIFSTHSSEFSSVPDGMTKIRFITNHDKYAWDETPTEAYGEQGSVGAFVATSFMAGVPMIYNGQEVAEPDFISFFDKDPINWSQNPNILAQYQEIMSTRAELIDIVNGNLTTYNHSDAIIFKKSKGGNEILVLVNTRDHGISLNLASDLQNTTWTNALTDDEMNLETSLTLGSYDYFILIR